MNAWIRGCLALSLIVASAPMVRAATEDLLPVPTAVSSALQHGQLAAGSFQNAAGQNATGFDIAQLMDDPPADMTEAEDDYHEHTPGWTGRTLVPGSGSTLAGAADATERQQTGHY